MRMLEQKVKASKINQIFISHLHGDHTFGLIGLLTTYNLIGRETPLEVFGPQGLEEMIRIQLRYSETELRYPLRFTVIDPACHKVIFENSLLTVESLPLVHRLPTTGFLFREKSRPRNILPEQIEAYDIPVAQIQPVKEGADLLLADGRRVPNEVLTVAPPSPRSYAYCSDTRYTEAIVPWIKGVDLLYHESTFLEDNRKRAEETLHATAREAALIAKMAGVGQLILGHYSSRYTDIQRFAREAAPIFPNTIAGYEGLVVEVPFREDERV